MQTVDEQVKEIQAILAGSPLIAVHESERLELARVKIVDLAQTLVSVPYNDRPITIESVIRAGEALTFPGQEYVAQEVFNPGTVGVAPQRPLAPPGSAAAAVSSTEGEPWKVCFRSVAIGVSTIVIAGLILRSAAGRKT